MYAVSEQMSSRCFVETFSQWSDEELLLEYRLTQDRGAFEELVHRYERELYNYLCHYLGNRELAEDAFQTTFLQIHLKGDQFEEGRKFRPWLFRIATNQAIDIRRKNRRNPSISLDTYGEKEDDGSSRFVDTVLSNEPEPMQSLLADERVKEVRDALYQLPDILKEVLYLVYFQGMKYHEAAESLGIPFGTVRSRLCAAVKKLNLVLAEDSVMS